MFTVGDVVRGRYRVERTLAHDDSCARFAVLDLETGRMLALKTAARERLGSEQLAARFRREWLLSQRVSHPNVLRVESVFELKVPGVEEPLPCVLSELVEGQNLAERLARDGAMAPEEALPLACQFAEALAASHRAGVVHRDLKPENVILATDEGGLPRAVLAAFGVARGTVEEPADEDTDALTATNVVLGTPVYMAPEQLEEQSATPATDIYALGLMLFEMVTGRLPFMAPSTLQAVFKRVREDPPSPRLFAPQLDVNWERAILGCLAREPAHRYRDADAVVRALRGDWVAPAGAAAARQPRNHAYLGWLLVAMLLAAAAVVVLTL